METILGSSNDFVRSFYPEVGAIEIGECTGPKMMGLGKKNGTRIKNGVIFGYLFVSISGDFLGWNSLPKC